MIHIDEVFALDGFPPLTLSKFTSCGKHEQDFNPDKQHGGYEVCENALFDGQSTVSRSGFVLVCKVPFMRSVSA